jgi:ketosteroid isomerase-like protein
MSFLAPDVIYDISRYSAGGGVFRGPEGVREGFREWTGAWEDYRIEILEVIDAGDDKVVVAARQAGKARGSGVPVEVVNAVVNTVRNDKIIRVDVYRNKSEALEAVGLSE